MQDFVHQLSAENAIPETNGEDAFWYALIHFSQKPEAVVRRSWGGRGAVVQRSNPDRRWPQAGDTRGYTRAYACARASACMPARLSLCA